MHCHLLEDSPHGLQGDTEQERRCRSHWKRAIRGCEDSKRKPNIVGAFKKKGVQLHKVTQFCQKILCRMPSGESVPSHLLPSTGIHPQDEAHQPTSEGQKP